MPIVKGATDGSKTEVLDGAVTEGMQVITSLTAVATASSETKTNPLNPTFGRRR